VTPNQSNKNLKPVRYFDD